MSIRVPTFNNMVFFFYLVSLGRRIPIPLPNTGALARKRNTCYLRAVLVFGLAIFAFLELHIINYGEYTNTYTLHVE